LNKEDLKKAIEIRAVEEKLIDLFSKGQLTGTVHTSIGQEFSATAFCFKRLQAGDKVFSNHRCHGHFLALTDDVDGFLLEMMGKEGGVCGGIGSSQHLYSSSFMSNGTQGNLAPVALGSALSFNLFNSNNIAILFIGDGTMGEGVVYETMNIASLWSIPLLIVCENNGYAQSTPVEANLAGSIKKRVEAFDIQYYTEETKNVEELSILAQKSIDYVRKERKPAFFEVITYRLAAHSKGDDDRPLEEVSYHKKIDPINNYKKKNQVGYNEIRNKIDKKINEVVSYAENMPETKIENYYKVKPQKNNGDVILSKLAPIRKFQGRLLNQFFINKLKSDSKTIFVGEDVLSPYGGAFKIASGLSDLCPAQVFSTPISESAIAGIGNGLALSGFKPYVEIMFGDFFPLIMEQVINGASKFEHMYNHNINCPVVYRTPMGGKRGYGPTHSQSLDRFLIGIDNVKVFALNLLLDPKVVYDFVHEEKGPSIVIENKLDYGRFILFNIPIGYSAFLTNQDDFTCLIKKEDHAPNVTIFTYGGCVTDVLDAVEHFSGQISFDIVVPTVIHPLSVSCVIKSLKKSKKLIAIEEGSFIGSVSSELIGMIGESEPNLSYKLKRVGSLPVAIPSVRSLEDVVLPSKNRIIKEIREFLNESN